MKFEKLHFLYQENDKKPESAKFAKLLIDAFGQSTPEEADAIISIGGDGLLLQALHNSAGKPVYPITPPESNSCGFWTNHDVTTVQQLIDNLEKAETVLLQPLKAEIKFTNGKSTIKYAFNDVAIERATGQSALIELTAVFGKAAAGPHRIMGDGFIFSTALGSTGTNRSYNGPITDIRNNVIILNGKGIQTPRGMAPMIAKGEETEFSIIFGSVEQKRPVRIDYDGLSISKDTDGSPVSGLVISMAPEKTAQLLTTREPAVRAFASMMS